MIRTKIQHVLDTGTTIRFGHKHLTKLNALLAWHKQKTDPRITMVGLLRNLVDREMARIFGTVLD